MDIPETMTEVGVFVVAVVVAAADEAVQKETP